MNIYQSEIPPLPIVEGLEFRLLTKFPGYAVSSDGQLWSCRHCCHWKRHLPFRDRWRIKKGTVDKKAGYVHATLTIDGTYYNFNVHVLVAVGFHGAIPEGYEVSHFPDKTRSNNAISNLKIVTRLENMAHKHEQGTAQIGVNNPNVKMTDSIVRQLRTLHLIEKVSIRELSRRTELDRATLSDAIHGRTWKHIT